MGNLSVRMKEYEKVSSSVVLKKTPVMLRIDGKAFHTFTKQCKFEKPYSDTMRDLFTNTVIDCARDIQGFKLAYLQSDEVSILLMDNDSYDTQPLFDNKVQKIVSVVASMFTAYFNIHFNRLLETGKVVNPGKPALFDCRIFNLPPHEIRNYLIWRQQDATRNSIQMLARSYFSHKELLNLNNSQIQQKLFTEVDINWNDVEPRFKRGHCVYKGEDIIVDNDIPIFTEDSYILDRYLNVGN